MAVKVQYPGVSAAVRADPQNLEIIIRLLRRMARASTRRPSLSEVKARIGEELDYELEAENQRAMARTYRGHPFILVPEVISSLSRERVLVSEFVRGVGFEALKRLPPGAAGPDRRDHLPLLHGQHLPPPPVLRRSASGTTCCSTMGGSLPGLRPVQRMEPAAVELELACERAVVEATPRPCTGCWPSGFLPDPASVDPGHLLEFIADAIWWYTTADEPIELTPEMATRVAIEELDPRSRHFREMRHQDMRPEHLIGRRTEADAGRARAAAARANWHRIAREWMYGDPPVTELASRRRPSTATEPSSEGRRRL